MANTFTSLNIHVVFSTKKRERWLRADIEEDVWRYLGGICRAHKVTPFQIGGFDDHVHLLLGVLPTMALSDIIKRLKGESSKWISDSFQGMKGFTWQDGYGAFTIGRSQMSATIRYIQNQREHHKVTTFEDEYRKFLRVHAIEPDERYIFG